MTTKHEVLTQIAHQHLGIETLEPRNRDSLDFRDVGVVGVQRALDAAYRVGQAELLAAAEALVSENERTSESIEHYKRLAECWRRLRRAIRHAKKQNALPKP